MKKYITIAALLAAGASLSNAADVGIQTFSGGQTYVAGTTIDGVKLVSDMTTGNPSLWNLDDNRSDSSGTLPNITGGNFFAGDYTLSLWLDASAFDTSGNVLLFVYSPGYSSNSAGYNGLVWNGADKTLTMGRGNFVANGFSMTYDGDNKSSVTLEDSLSGLINITLSVAGLASSQSVTYWINGTEIVTASSYNGNMNGGNAETYMSYSYNTNVVYGDVSLSNEKLTTQEAIYNLMGVAPIPEPSTFGLLAGLGALALVGTRRRRK